MSQKDPKLRIGVIGGGVGGLTAALALRRCGFAVKVFERSNRDREIGAGVGLGPNAVKVFRALGLEEALLTHGCQAEDIVGRNWTTGETLFRVPMKASSKAKYGAAHIQIHRADLLTILERTEIESDIHLASRVVAVSSAARSARVRLADGVEEEFDLIVGCDGLHSTVRATIDRQESPRFTGHVCWRALIPTATLPPRHITPDMTVWIGPGGHVVTYYVRDGSFVNLVAFRQVEEAFEESWSVEVDKSDLSKAYPEVGEGLRTIFDRAETCFKWGLFDRLPLNTWTANRITMLGDAAHPMLPFLGQGAATAIEDGYVLAQELSRSPDDVERALRSYELKRVARTTRIQTAARTQPRFVHHTDQAAELNSDWLYGHDATQA